MKTTLKISLLILILCFSLNGSFSKPSIYKMNSISLHNEIYNKLFQWHGEIYIISENKSSNIWTIRNVTQAHVHNKFKIMNVPQRFAPDDIISDGRNRLVILNNSNGQNKFGCIYLLKPNHTLRLLHQFDGIHGADPNSIIMTSPNVFVGTAADGGKNNCGILFRLNTKGIYSILHEFDLKYGSKPSCIVSENGNAIYGCTSEGGKYGYGTIYQIRTDMHLSVIHYFDGRNGAYPQALCQSNNGTLFGYTSGIASFIMNSDGKPNLKYPISNFGNMIFKISPNNKKYEILHRFNGLDGLIPNSIQFGKHNALIGTTLWGGKHNEGTLYIISNYHKYTLLHSYVNSIPVELELSSNNQFLYVISISSEKYTPKLLILKYR